nr:hypothetical protein [Tanacetum cinerariifolium]
RIGPREGRRQHDAVLDVNPVRIDGERELLGRRGGEAQAVISRFFLLQRLYPKTLLATTAVAVAHEGVVVVHGRPKAVANGAAQGHRIDEAEARRGLPAHVAAKVAVALGPAGQVHQQARRNVAFQ